MEQSAPNIFGHKPALFLLFFTEMWERFSYYGMRALLVLFLVSQFSGGWGWSRSEALKLYGIYTGLVYLTPIIGGWIADQLIGFRKAVILGALLMTLGHGSMALETETTFYLGLGLLILGNGLFKPNISSIVGQLYADEPGRKDGAYTIFYMGINSGAFLGILLCGYIGEKVSWSLGFGLAGIFMLLGMIMFYLGQSILGEHGLKPTKTPPKKEDVSPEESPVVIRDRLLVICILSLFTIFFWMSFEQQGGSMTVFANDYTERILKGSSATIFFWANTLLTVVPLAMVTYVLGRLVGVTFNKIAFSNISIITSFVLVWLVALWMLNKEFKMSAYEVSFFVPTHEVEEEDEDGNKSMKTIEAATLTKTIRSDGNHSANDSIRIADLEGKFGEGKIRVLANDAESVEKDTFNATVISRKENETEVPASWFGILNSFFIISCAPLISRIWETRINPSAPVKFGIGLILVGIGFGFLGVGSMGIGSGDKSAALSMWWLIFAYFFHTMGELCISPVGLSYVSKLAPAKFVGLMFGVWFLCTAIANYLAGFTGSYIDQVSENYGLSVFFFMFTALTAGAGVVIWLLNGFMVKKMHGVK